MRSIRVIGGVWLACSATACVHIPAHTFQSSPVAVPVPPVQSQGVLTLSNSDFRSLEGAAVAKLPPTIDTKRVPGGCPVPCYHFEYRTGTGSLHLQSGGFVLHGEYKGRIETKDDGRGLGLIDCILDPFYLGTAVQARPKLVHDAPGWFVTLSKPKLTPTRLPGSDTRCSIPLTPFTTNIAGDIDDKLKSMGNDDLAASLERVKIRVPIDNLDAKLRGPIDIPISEGRHVCLYPRVTGVQVGALTGIPLSCVGKPFCNAIARIPPEEESLESVTVPFAFSSAPTALLTKETCPAGGALLGLSLLPDEPQPGAPFRILAAAGIDYPTLSALVKSQLKSRHGKNGALGLSFKPADVHVGDAHGQVFVQIDLSGSLRGTIYFWGTPVLSPDHKTISVPGVHLAAESCSALHGLDVRLPDVIVNLFQPTLEKALVFDVDKIVSPLISAGNRTFPFDGGSLSLSGLQLTVLSVQSVPSELQVNVRLEGRATGSIHP
jgi:uncharacterized protein DUF4403